MRESVLIAQLSDASFKLTSSDSAGVQRTITYPLNTGMFDTTIFGQSMTTRAPRPSICMFINVINVVFHPEEHLCTFEKQKFILKPFVPTFDNCCPKLNEWFNVSHH